MIVDQPNIKSLSLFHRRAWVEVTLRSNYGIPSTAIVDQVFLTRFEVLIAKVNLDGLTKF